MSSTLTPDIASGSTALLTVDLTAIGENYQQLSKLANGAECAAVVKADAYGLGAARIAQYLVDCGCRTFFVATLGEGIALRKHLSDAKIFILDGLFKGAGPEFTKYNLAPVLGSLEMLEHWAAYCALRGESHPAALHFDTGMNRLGFGVNETKEFMAHRQELLIDLKIELVMSHLACADEPEHPASQRQHKLFTEIITELQPLRASLANSSGIFLGSSFAFDLVRPGIALYGGRPTNDPTSSLRPVMSLTTHITQIRNVKKGGEIGYGGVYSAKRDTRLATLPVGYADGYHRSLGSSDDQPGANAYIGEFKTPLLGRVSMDLITIDITDVPIERAVVGTPVELLGQHVLIDDLAEISGTISYEILTSLGDRYERHYVGGK